MIINKMVWVFINNIVHATTLINAGIYRGATCICNLCYIRDNILLYYYMIYIANKCIKTYFHVFYQFINNTYLISEGR